MKNIMLEVPEEVDELDVKFLVAAILFDKGVLSSGQGAEMLGISRESFLNQVGNYGISVFGENQADLSKIKDLEL
jgi:hypothetical protein